MYFGDFRVFLVKTREITCQNPSLTGFLPGIYDGFPGVSRATLMDKLSDKLSKLVKLVVSFHIGMGKYLEKAGMSDNIIHSAYNPFEGWVTFKEAGEIINRNHSTIRYWAETGKIVSYPVGNGGLRLVYLEDVKDYSENHSYRLPPEKRGRLKQSDE